MLENHEPHGEHNRRQGQHEHGDSGLSALFPRSLETEHRDLLLVVPVHDLSVNFGQV